MHMLAYSKALYFLLLVTKQFYEIDIFDEAHLIQGEAEQLPNIILTLYQY